VRAETAHPTSAFPKMLSEKLTAVLLEHGASSIVLEIEGKWRRLIVDTGSSVSIFQPGVSRRDLRDTSLRPFVVTGETLDVKGRQLAFLRWEERNSTI
jgi:hypothetical protein